jgi:hypothetical protein
MRELKDYSGDYKPDLKLEDFSKDFLVKMMIAWGRAYINMTECWFQAVKEQMKVSNEECAKCETLAWKKIAETSVPKIAKSLDIEVKDIVDAMKVWQILPDGPRGGVFDTEVEVKDRNHIMLTVTKCRSLDWMEKNAPYRIEPMCHELEVVAFNRYLTVFLPNAHANPVKLPPRKSPNEVPCIWEIKLKSTR